MQIKVIIVVVVVIVIWMYIHVHTVGVLSTMSYLAALVNDQHSWFYNTPKLVPSFECSSNLRYVIAAKRVSNQNH